MTARNPLTTPAAGDTLCLADGRRLCVEYVDSAGPEAEVHISIGLTRNPLRVRHAMWPIGLYRSMAAGATVVPS